MKRMIVAIVASCLAPVAGIGEEADDDLKRFDRFATSEFKTTECGDDDKGRYQFSCRNIETGDISGYISYDKLKTSANGRLIEKYWGTGDRLKFVGVACGRGATEAEAKTIARIRAAEIVRRAVQNLEETVLVGDFEAMGYRKDEERVRCVPTSQTAEDDPADEGGGDLAELLRNIQIQNNQARADAERQAQEAAARRRKAQEQARLAAERERQATTLIVDVKSLDKYAVELAFYSDTYKNRAWPGGNRIFPLNDSLVHTYRLNCRKGEKICYGAWRRSNPDSWWGSGYGGRKHCDDCCMICGGKSSRTLLAGADTPAPSSSQGGNAANALADILGGVAAGIGAANAIRAQQAPAYRSPPTPQGPTRRQSTISGGR